MQFNLKKYCEGEKYGGYACHVDNSNCAGHGKTIEAAINDYLNCIEHYKK